MAVDAFLSMVTGGKAVVGESQDATFGKDSFEIKDFSFDVENHTTIGSATGGAGAGKVKFNEFTIKKLVDKASPALFQYMASGSHFEKVILSCRKAGGGTGTGTGKAFLIYEFATVFITSIEHELEGEEGNESPEETIEFVYGALQIKYAVQDAKGQLGAPVQGTWSQVTNKAALQT
jgi:type VI secretion system secreted protein Hcp